MTKKCDNSKHIFPALVFLSGYRSDMQGTKATYIDTLAKEMSFDYLRFDYSGHGESEGNFNDLTLSDWIDDSTEIIEYVFGTERPLVIIGSSMGAWIAIKLFERLKNKNLKNRITHFIALAPAPDFTKILMHTQRNAQAFKDQIATWGFVRQKCDYEDMDFIITEKFLNDGDNNSVLDTPIKFDGIVHILQGMQDTDVPYQHALLLTEKLTTNNVTIQILKSSNHRLSEPHDLLCLKNIIMRIKS